MKGGLALRVATANVLRVLFAAACAVALCAGAAASDWPEFMGPARDQTSPDTDLIDTFPPAGPKPLWEKRIGTGYSAPSIRGDLLVMHHRIGDDEVVEGCDAGTGETRWTHRYPSRFIDPFGYNNGPRATPLLTANRCYTFGAEGVLTCVDSTTGAQVWRRDTHVDYKVPEAFFGAGSSPILEGGLLIVQVGGQPNAGVVAFDAESGKTVWENVGEKTWNGVPMTGWPGQRTVRWNTSDPTFDKQASYCTPVAATIHGRRHLLCCTRQGLVSLDPKSGAANFAFWFRSRANESVNAMTPVVAGDLVLLSSAYYKTGAVAVRVKEPGTSVEEVWRSLALEVHWTRPVFYEGHVYSFSGRNEPDANFRCVELKSGAVKWARDEKWRPGTRQPPVFGRGSAILADGKLIVLGEGGLLGLFRPNTERVDEVSRWQVPQLRYPCWAAPVLSNKRLYLSNEERLVCFDFAR